MLVASMSFLNRDSNYVKDERYQTEVPGSQKSHYLLQSAFTKPAISLYCSILTIDVFNRSTLTSLVEKAQVSLIQQ